MKYQNQSGIYHLTNLTLQAEIKRQEADFDDSISRLILSLGGNALSTNWSFNELKTLVGKIVAGECEESVIAKSGENQ